jgi:hypothetical protein
MMGDLISSIAKMLGLGGKADALALVHRKASVDAGVGWWTTTLRGREGIDDARLEAFGQALKLELASLLDKTFRVYLEVNHQPKGVLREVALTVGLNMDAFPPGTTMTVTDVKVAISTSALAPYEQLHAA